MWQTLTDKLPVLTQVLRRLLDQANE
ncbi:hypothetical protein [Goodfellowiella coeruleoviolacea]|nr:hypothetical protein [Goodfellowiella coeruleoviolacea]